MIELDMQMPATCSDCPIYDGEYGWCNVDHNIHTSILDLNERPENCPLKERKTGKWIGYAGTIGNECSVCHKWLDVLQGTAAMNYCPNCGASMVNED